MTQQIFSQEDLISIISNTDRRYQILGKDYILIVKNEGLKPCSIYISDCQEAIWFKVVDISFFSLLKKELQLTSSLKVFSAHFVKSLQSNSSLAKEKSILIITIHLGIGEGLTMSTSIRIENRVHYNNPQNFKLNLRKFITFLWEVKNSQLNKQKEKEELTKLQKQKKAEEEEQEKRKIKAGFSKKPGNRIKKGDLMNPQRKRRKKLGAKLGTGYQQDMFVTPTSHNNSISPLYYAKK